MLTFSDMMTHLSTQIGVPPVGAGMQKVRTSVSSAWARLFDMHMWRYYHRIGHIQMGAAQATGSVEFDLTTRRVTLTDATWPTDVTAQHIRLVNSWYSVKERVSATVIELYENEHPSVDLEAGTSYYVQQVLHPLPYNVGDVVQVIDPEQTMRLSALTLLETHSLSEIWGQLTQPTSYCLIASPRYPRQWCLWVPTVLNRNAHLSYLYVIRKPDSFVPSVSAGTVTVSAGTATFSDAVCSSNWVGCVLRVSRNEQPPTGEYGSYTNPNAYNTDTVEVLITEYTDSTHCEVADITVSVATASPFEVSSHLDIKPGAMQVLLQRLAEDEYGARPVGNHMEGISSKRRIQRAAEEAMSSDSLSFQNGSNFLPMWYSLRLSDLASRAS